MSPRSITRRDFLKVAAAAPLAGAAFPAVTGGSPAPALAPGLEKVRVVLVRDPGPLGPKGAPPALVGRRLYVIFARGGAAAQGFAASVEIDDEAR